MRSQWKQILLVLFLLFALAGCGTREELPEEAGTDTQSKTPEIGLILSSEDDPENEAVMEAFEKAAAEAGAKLQLRIPEVSHTEAAEAVKLSEGYELCEVDPLEYQMLFVNELVAEDVDVIAIHANHRDGLEPVLSAARALGIRVCAFGLEVNEESCDLYAETEDAAEAAAGLLD